ncbi:MAG: beta-galactosidase [Planctomycetia bacterium]|nr:beta-galactosidase [Planctomycetia bacterium]
MKKLWTLLCFFLPCWTLAEERIIFQPTQTEVLTTDDATVTLSADKSRAEVLAIGKKYPWPGIRMTGTWNFSDCQTILVEVENLSDESLPIALRLDDASSLKNGKGWHSIGWSLAPHERSVHEVPILPNLPESFQGKIVGMNGLPGGTRKDAPAFQWGRVLRFMLFTTNVEKPKPFALYRITAITKDSQSVSVVDWRSMTPEQFFPFIDVYGQFKYEDWPGKIHSDADFPERIAAEKADWEKNPRPSEWGTYGGWKNGPRLEATGRFYVKKVDGKWWFVDPEGYLFWSHGVDCVGMSSGATPLSTREHYFENLPEQDSPFAKFYSTGWSSLHYYKDKSPYRTYNFSQSNLLRKYGPDYATIYADAAHNRLASWGMNTIANWSDANIYKLRKTPYVLTINSKGPLIAGSTGYWGKFPDPFAPEFRDLLRKTIATKREFLNDPWCIGTFVNNEMSWGSDRSLSSAALSSPANQPAKIAMVDWLKAKYGEITKLNAAWKTDYADWDAILASEKVPENEALYPDLEELYTVIAEQYFRVVHEELRAADPKLLDMGCRFAWTNERAQRAMAKYVDVMSFNLYRESVADFAPAGEIDMPVIIGEFHFGALDRGMFHTGLRGAKNQNERAEKYYSYVLGAVKNPRIIGAHWFQYASQATTGRGDGENYQIGLVDLGDTPYPEILAKVREMGRTMYSIRSGK